MAEDSDQDGFVLIPIVAVVLVFIAVSGAIAVQSRLTVAQETNRIRTLGLGARVDGIARLLSARLGGDLKTPHSGVACATDDGVYRVRIVDEDARLDLNAAGISMITDVLTASGFEPDDVKHIAGEIIDYRDDDNIAQPLYGAEEFEYQRAGLAWGPRNGFFLDTEEVAQLPSVASSPLLRAKLLPLVTTFNGRGAIDAAALKESGVLSGAQTSNETGLKKWHVPSRHIHYSVSVEARSRKHGATFARLAVVSIGAAGRPQILKWARQQLSSEDERSEIESADSAGAAHERDVCRLVSEAIGSLS